PIAVPLLTVVMSGVVASIVTFRLNARLQRQTLLRGKYEEAYSALTVYCNVLGGHFLKYLKVFSGDIDINQANDLTIKNSKDSDAAASRQCEMLLSIYIPTAQSAFSDLMNARAA